MKTLSERRVLVVTNMYPTAQYPAFGTFVKTQVEGLRERGLAVDVFVVSRKKRRLSYLDGARRFRQRIRVNRYDLIHAHYVFSGIIARLQCRYPILLTHHGIEVLRGWTAPVSWIVSRLADRVIVTSEEMRRALGLPRADIIPCGVDLELFKPLPKQASRAQLHLPPDKKLVLFVGELRPEKRIDIIERAVAMLQREDECVELVVATGQSHENIPLYMSACDVLALASDYEGSPVVIKEAMACNLPIVSVDVGDVAQVIGGTEGCYICRREPADMARKLKMVLDEGQRTNGRHAVQCFASHATIDHLLRVYEELWR